MKRPDVATLKAQLNKPRVRKTGTILFGLFLVLVAVLFFAGPPLIKSYFVETLSHEMNRKISLGEVKVNPFTLSVTLRDLRVLEPDGKTIYLGLRELYANAQLASVVFGGPVLREVRVVEPYVHVVRYADESYNFEKSPGPLLQRRAEVKKGEAKPLSFSINNIQISGGSVDFEDEVKGRKHEIRQLKAAVPFLSNLFYRVDDYVQPEFSALVNGAELKLSGRSKPFETVPESALELKLDHVVLAEYLPYVPKKLYFSLPSGTLDTDLKISFLLPKDKAPILAVSGRVALDDVALNEQKDTPTLRLKRAEVVLGSIEPLLKRYTVDRVAVSNLEVFARRDRSGRINLANLVEPDPKQEPLPYFLVREALVDQSTLHVRDEARARPLELALTDIRIAAHNITSEKGKAGQVELNAAGPNGAAVKAGADVTLEPLAVGRLNLQIDDLRLTPPGSKTEFARVGRFSIAGGNLDLQRRSASVDEVVLAKSQINVHRNRQGVLNVMEFAGIGSEANTESTPPAASESAPAWTYTVKQLGLDDVALRWRDEVPAEGPAEIGFDGIDARVENLSSAPKSVANLTLKARGSRGGTLSVEGDSTLQPSLSARLKLAVQNLHFLAMQPYFADQIHITLTKGTVSARGQLQVEAPNQARYLGDLQVNRFASVDRVNRNDFLKWETLHFGGVNLSTAPLSVAINEISLSNFYSRLVINPDGSLNVQHVMGKEAGSKEAAAGEMAKPAEAEKAAPAPAPASAEAMPKPAPVPIKIGRIALQGGHVNFSDNFIKPNYSANLTQIGGSVSGLSSDLASTADLDLRGKVDDAAPVEIAGKLNPLSGNLFLDIAASAKGVDLPGVTPYSERYAGYPITKGKLSMDVKYHIEDRQLKAENRVVLDQLTFGEKVDSPDATKLPVLLAVALLKDRNGVIDINLPVSGSMDDPEFSIGGLVFKVIMNLLVKAVTSPFALLGSLFGGGEELAYIEFEPGRTLLDQTARDKVQSLTKALEDRPALKLDITGRVDPEADREGLRQVALEQKVKAVKLEAVGKQDNAPATLDEVKVDPAEYPKLLKEAYGREKFPKPRNLIGLAKDLPVPEMEKLMLANITVGDDDLRQLAIRRARAVADTIANTGKVGTERVFVLEPKLKPGADEKGVPAGAKASRVDFSLK